MFEAQVLLAYARHRGLAQPIGARMRVWLEQKGCKRALAVRRGGDPAAFMRVTRHFGRPIVAGTVIQYEFA